MSEIMPNDLVVKAFQDAKECMGARDCKKLAEAMCAFYASDNQKTLETGDGRITFATPPSGQCMNSDQLFCQDR